MKPRASTTSGTWAHRWFVAKMVVPSLAIGIAFLAVAVATAVAEVAGDRGVALVYAGCGLGFVYLADRVRRAAVAAGPSRTDDEPE